MSSDTSISAKKKHWTSLPTYPSTRRTPESFGTDTALRAVSVAFRLLVHAKSILLRHQHRRFTIKLLFHRNAKESDACQGGVDLEPVAAANPPPSNVPG